MRHDKAAVLVVFHWWCWTETILSGHHHRWATDELFERIPSAGDQKTEANSFKK